VRQPVEPEPKIEHQPLGNVPVVVSIKAVVVVDPVFAGQKLQLGEAGGVTEQEIDIGVAGKRVGVEECCSLGICLQLLVFVIVQPTEAKFELVPSLGPGQVVTVLEAFVSILPWKVAWAPGYIQRGAPELDLRQAAHFVISSREKAVG
jgi:hypothetical protein